MDCLSKQDVLRLHFDFQGRESFSLSQNSFGIQISCDGKNVEQCIKEAEEQTMVSKIYDSQLLAVILEFMYKGESKTL